jgi:rhodanese-related sulfurtransferase
MMALADRPDLAVGTVRLSPALAQETLADGQMTALDVRTPSEHEQKAIAGALHVPLSRLAARAGELPADRPLMVYCAGGYRSSVAASVLAARGFDVRELAGGIAAWEQAGLPLELSH